MALSPLNAALRSPALQLTEALLQTGTPRENAVHAVVTTTAAAIFCALFPASAKTSAPLRQLEVLPPSLRPADCAKSASVDVVTHMRELQQAAKTLCRRSAPNRKHGVLCPTILARLPGEMFELLSHTAFSGDESAALRERRLHSGSFYTPQALVDEICRLAEPTPADHILDPAMGCGHFLLGAVDALSTILPDKELPDWATEHLSGWDMNPAAVATARLCLWLRLSRPNKPFLFHAENLRACDTLLEPFRAPAFTCILGNPPYDVLTNFSRFTQKAELAAQLRGSGQYPLSVHGQINLYRCFIERGLQLLEPAGRLAFIVPATLAADRAAGALREALLQRHGADAFRFLEENDPAFPGICQATVIFRAYKDRGAAPAVQIRSRRNTFVLQQQELVDFHYILPRCTKKELALLRWLQKHCTSSFGEIATARVGEVDQTVYRDCIRNTPTGTLLLRGCHLESFRADLSAKDPLGRYLDLDAYRAAAGSRYAIIEPLLKQTRVVQMGIRNLTCRPRLVAALLRPGVYCGNSVNVYLPRSGWSAAFLAGLLNSSLYDTLFRLRSTNNNINLHEILCLPLPSAKLLHPGTPAVRAVENAFFACEKQAIAWEASPACSTKNKKPAACRDRLNQAVSDLFQLPKSLRP